MIPRIDPDALLAAFNAAATQLAIFFNPASALNALIRDDPDRAQELLAHLPDDALATVERAATQLAYRAADIRADRAKAD